MWRPSPGHYSKIIWHKDWAKKNTTFIKEKEHGNSFFLNISAHIQSLSHFPFKLTDWHQYFMHHVTKCTKSKHWSISIPVSWSAWLTKWLITQQAGSSSPFAMLLLQFISQAYSTCICERCQSYISNFENFSFSSSLWNSFILKNIFVVGCVGLGFENWQCGVNVKLKPRKIKCFICITVHVT